MSKGTKINQTALSFALLAILTLFPGCTKKPEPEGYRVISYDAATHQWIILRTGTWDGKYLTKRLTVVCSSYQWVAHERINGPEACGLQVGRIMIPKPFPPMGKPQEFLDIFEEVGPTGGLWITEGDGADQVMQHFDILKYEVLPDDSSR